MKKLGIKLKYILKNLFLTKEGWISWFIANTITTLPWLIPFVYGFIFNDSNAYIISASIWTFMILPFTPFWMINVLISVLCMKYIFKKEITHG